MAYGTLLSDVVQSSTANTPVQFNDGNGTQVGTLCRAWVNFNGTGTPAIRASFNVSSITDNGTGLYTINFTTALPDANYSAVGTPGESTNTGNQGRLLELQQPTTTTILVRTFNGSFVLSDFSLLSVAIFR